MRSLVINLTRFGDLLQTQPAISALAAQGETGVVCLENFVQATGLLSDLSAVYSLPSAKLLHLTNTAWPQAVGELRQWADNVWREFQPDAVVNLTPSLPGRLLSRYWSDARNVGMGLDELGFAANATPWADFLQTASTSRGCSPFNVADLFRYVAGMGAFPGCFHLRRPGKETMRTVGALLGAVSPAVSKEILFSGSPRYVGMQLGASEARRRWPLEYFVALGEHLALSGVVPVLLGGPGERTLAERYTLAAQHFHVDCVGRTSLEELAGVLASVHLLVTNDTGTMHLAAGLGTPILAIFLCTAQPWDTGPYLAGSLCLEPDMVCHPCAFGTSCPYDHGCRWTITPQAVAEFVVNHLETGQWGEWKASMQPDSGLRGWRSGFDDHGFMALEPLPGQPVGDREIWITLQRIFYRQFLDGQPVDLPVQTVRQLSSQAREAIRATLNEARAVVALLGKQALVLSQVPRPALKNKFLAYWQRLCSLLTESSHFSPMGRLMLSQAQEEGGSLQRIIAILQSYEGLFTGILEGMGQQAVEKCRTAALHQKYSSVPGTSRQSFFRVLLTFF